MSTVPHDERKENPTKTLKTLDFIKSHPLGIS